MVEFANGGFIEDYDPNDDSVPEFMKNRICGWSWTSDEIIDPELVELLRGPEPVHEPEHAVRISVPAKDEQGEVKQIDFILYRVQFTPFRFNYWNKWYKKLVRRVCGARFAYWLFYRNALKINYSGKTLLSEPESIGRVV